MDLKTVGSVALCLNAGFISCKNYKFKVQSEVQHARRPFSLGDVITFRTNSNRTLDLLRQQNMYLPMLLLVQGILTNQCCITAQTYTVVKDIILQVMITHILGAVESNTNTLYNQTSMHTLFLIAVSGVSYFLNFGQTEYMVLEYCSDLLAVVAFGTLAKIAINLWFKYQILANKSIWQDRINQIIDTNPALKLNEMSLMPIMNDEKAGLQLCGIYQNCALTNSAEETIQLINALSFQANVREHDSTEDMQSGEVNDKRFVSIDFLMSFIQNSQDRKLFSGTAQENRSCLQKNSQNQTNLCRDFKFVIQMCGNQRNEFLLGLKQESQMDSIQNTISSLVASRQTDQSQFGSMCATTQTEPVEPNNTDNGSLFEKDYINQSQNRRKLPRAQTGSQNNLSQKSLSQQPETAFKAPQPGAESKSKIGSRIFSSSQLSNLRQNVFFYSSHVQSDISDGENSNSQEISACRLSRRSQVKVSLQNNQLTGQQNNHQTSHKSQSQKLLNRYNNVIDVSSSVSDGDSKSKQAVVKFSQQRVSSKQNVTSVKSFSQGKQLRDYQAINMQLIDQINKLKCQVETNKIFTYMVIHDLKHPTESLIDSLSSVTNQLRKLENTIGKLQNQSKNIIQTNELTSTKLREIRANVDIIQSEFNEIARVRMNNSQDMRQKLLSKNFSDRSNSQNQKALSVHLNRLSANNSSSVSQVRAQDHPRLQSHQVVNSEEEIKMEVKNKKLLSQVDSKQVEVQIQARDSILSADSFVLAEADFDEQVRVPEIGDQVIKSNSSLFRLARKDQKLPLLPMDSNNLSQFDNVHNDEPINQQSFIGSSNRSNNSSFVSEQYPEELQFRQIQPNQNQVLDLGFGQLSLAEIEESKNNSNDTRGRFEALKVSSKPANQFSGSLPGQQISINLQAQSQTLLLNKDLNEAMQNQTTLGCISDQLGSEITVSLNQLKKISDIVNTLNYTSEMMRNLMMDLLDLAQMEKNTFKLNKDFFSLFDVIQQAFHLVSHVSNKKKITLRMPQVTDICQQKMYRQIYGDKNRFMQVIINFLSNSLKFSDQGSEIHLHLELLANHTLTSSEFRDHSFKKFNPRTKSSSAILQPQQQFEEGKQRENLISSLAQSNQDYTVSESMSGVERLSSCVKVQPSSKQLVQTSYIEFMLSIQDFGVGIPADKLDNLFINFGNLEEHQKTNPLGRGLGLSICKSIVEQMGGQVIVKSEVGKGSTFSMTFKVMCKVSGSDSVNYSLDQSLHPPKEVIIADSSMIEASQIQSNKPRLLLVNDEHFLLEAYELQLEEAFEVTTAENGYQALQIVYSVPQNHFDIILMDINMPIMDGFEACSRITDYLYDEDSFIKVTPPRRASLMHHDSQANQVSDQSNSLIPKKSQSHYMFDKILPVLLVSSKSSSRNKVEASLENQDVSMTQMRPLIFALTGDTTTRVMDKIKTYPFMGVFEKIGLGEQEFLVQQIISRQDAYKPHKKRVLNSKPKPRPVKSELNLTNSMKNMVRKEESVDYLNVILEHDEQCFSSNSVSSAEENESVCQEEQKQRLYPVSRKDLHGQIPYNNGLPNGVKIDNVQKMVNFIRQQSSDIKLKHFKPLDLSVEKFERNSVLSYQSRKHSHSMQDLAVILQQSNAVQSSQNDWQKIIGDQPSQLSLNLSRPQQLNVSQDQGEGESLRINNYNQPSNPSCMESMSSNVERLEQLCFESMQRDKKNSILVDQNLSFGKE